MDINYARHLKDIFVESIAMLKISFNPFESDELTIVREEGSITGECDDVLELANAVFNWGAVLLEEGNFMSERRAVYYLHPDKVEALTLKEGEIAVKFFGIEEETLIDPDYFNIYGVLDRLQHRRLDSLEPIQIGELKVA